MELLPPPELLNEYTSITTIIQDINKHAKEQGYAVIKRRSKQSKKGVNMKYRINCDRQGVPKQEGHEHKKTISKRGECPFYCIAKLQNNVEDEHGLSIWKLTVEHAEHSHDPIRPSGLVIHRKAELQKPEIQAELAKEWRKSSKVDQTLKGLRLNLEKPIFKYQDIWNYNRVLKAAAMRTLTPTQALMRYLTESSKWYVDYKKSVATDELEYLFFTPKCMQLLLAEYYEVLIMNCTYKTNKYKMPLLIITEVISSNTTFYVEFCFIKDEAFED